MKRTIQSLKVGDKLKMRADDPNGLGIKAGDIVTVLATSKSSKEQNKKNGVIVEVYKNEVWVSNPICWVMPVPVDAKTLNLMKAKLIINE